MDPDELGETDEGYAFEEFRRLRGGSATDNDSSS